MSNGMMFKEYLKEATANLHLGHLEDLVFDLGVNGTRTAIFFMRDVYDMLSGGSGNQSNKLTVKFDGAPAVFVGINPENGRFFVAKKGLFNANPKLYYSHADIDADTTGDLAHKLKVAFTECSKLGIKSGIYQGDIMYTSNTLDTKTIDGQKCVTFHPNTIMYAVPIDTALGARIKRSNIGIVWHTEYSGKTINTLSASFGNAIASKFRKTNTSWMEDATYTDVSGAATFTATEAAEFKQRLSSIGVLFRNTPAATLNAIHRDPDLLQLVHVYNNTKVREGKTITDAGVHTQGLYDFIFNRFQKDMDTKKTEKGRMGVDAKRTKILNFFASHPKSDIVKLFELTKQIAEAKIILVRKLNKASSLGTFLKTQNGLKVTSQEGFVAIRGEDAVKLVDRLEFSIANFSPEILKGFKSPR